MSKTVLVTGAAGFIGSHVAQQLALRGDTVVGLDNFNDYYAPDRKRANVAELLAATTNASTQPNIVEGDIRDRDLLGRLFSEHGFDAVVHLAAMPGVRASVEAPHLYIDVNLVGTTSLLECAREHNLGCFVFASTSSVYGNTTTIPFVETDNCDRTLAPYPATKRAVELMGYSYHHLHQLNFTAIRFFTVYGPRGRPDMMALRLLNNIFFGEDVPLYNRGQMHRDWTYVGDIAQGVVAAVDRPLGYEIVNLGRGEPVLLAEFIEEVERITGRKTNLRHETMHSADVEYTYADSSKASKLLGYVPQTSMVTGIERLWAWYQSEILAKRSGT